MCATALPVPYAMSIGPVVQEYIKTDGVHVPKINVDVYVMIHINIIMLLQFGLMGEVNHLLYKM